MKSTILSKIEEQKNATETVTVRLSEANKVAFDKLAAEVGSTPPKLAKIVLEDFIAENAKKPAP